MLIKTQWYVASWAHEIDREPVTRNIFGERVMRYRRFDRGVVASHDSCPHRVLPLSMGIKEGDNICCRSDGLLIDSERRAMAQSRPPKPS